MHNISGNAPGPTGKSEWWRWLNLLKSRTQHGHPGIGGLSGVVLAGNELLAPAVENGEVIT